MKLKSQLVDRSVYNPLLVDSRVKMTSRVEPGPLVPPKPNGTRFPSLMYPTDPKVELCARVDTYYDLTAAAVFLVCIVVGVLYTFLGKNSIFTVTQFPNSATSRSRVIRQITASVVLSNGYIG